MTQNKDLIERAEWLAARFSNLLDRMENSPKVIADLIAALQEAEALLEKNKWGIDQAEVERDRREAAEAVIEKVREWCDRRIDGAKQVLERPDAYHPDDRRLAARSTAVAKELAALLPPSKEQK